MRRLATVILLAAIWAGGAPAAYGSAAAEIQHAQALKPDARAWAIFNEVCVGNPAIAGGVPDAKWSPFHSREGVTALAIFGLKSAPRAQFWSAVIEGDPLLLRTETLPLGGSLCALAFKSRSSSNLQAQISLEVVGGEILGDPDFEQRVSGRTNTMWAQVTTNDWRTISYKFSPDEPWQFLETAWASSSHVSEPIGPALWVVRDKDSEVFLFGTVHSLKSGFRWRTSSLSTAFQSVDSLVFESADTRTDAERLAAGSRISASGRGEWRDRLPPEIVARLRAAARANGVEISMLERLRPSFAAILLSQAASRNAGHDPGQGADEALRRDAVAAGKSVSGLEPPDQMLKTLSGLSASDELALVDFTLAGMADGAAAARISSWARGDEAALDQDLLATMRTYPALYDLMIVSRNKAWALQIRTMLEGQGKAMVAVGAGHLVGKDSLQSQLMALGLEVLRVR